MSAVPPGADGELPEEGGQDRAEERRRVDVEAAWADIVAHWDAEPPAPRTWPAQEDAGPAPGAGPGDAPGPAPGHAPGHVPGHPPGPPGAATGGGEAVDPWHGSDRPPGRHRRRSDDADPAGTADPARPTGVPRPADARGAGGGEDDLDPAEDRYTPPEPPPLGRGGWRSWLPWVGVLGAPVFFLVYTLAHLSLPNLLLLGVVVAFVAGFVTLVLRLPTSRGDDDDDGAVV